MHRKFWTALFSLVVVLCLAFGFVGCDGPAGEGGEETKLATPSNLRIEQTALLWDAVENATGYAVKADGQESSVNGTSFSLAQLTEDKTYKLQVKATGGTGYEDSDWSAEISYTPATAPAGGHVIVSAEGFTVDGTTLYIKVSNATETFDFNDKITVSDGATWVLSNDALGESSIVTKTISLSEPGDKTVYIIVTGDDGYTSYTVTVRRRPVYNVTYVLGSGKDIVKKIEEDGFAAELTEDEIPDREGFEFKGYDYDFSQPITGDTTVKLKWDSGLHYIDENGETVPVENDYEILSAAADRTLTGWYILRGQVSGNFTLTVSGEAHIILDDGCFWTVTGNIIVPESAVLNIYAVSSGSETGSLTVGGNIGGKDGVDGENGEGEQFGPDGEDGTAGTDGTDGQDAGTIIINGGFIAAQAVGGGKGGRGGNGGVGSWGASGATTSNGVGLTGGSGGDGGKGGNGGSVECIVINGGNVDTGRIGGGFGGSGGDGGRGGLGGTGKHGIQGNTKSGGAGGKGGKGGSGGDGGTGGSIGEITFNGGFIDGYISGGDGGYGGDGGPGGAGGGGGDASSGTTNKGGKGGSGGIGGSGGHGGYNGTIGTAFVSSEAEFDGNISEGKYIGRGGDGGAAGTGGPGGENGNGSSAGQGTSGASGKDGNDGKIVGGSKVFLDGSESDFVNDIIISETSTVYYYSANVPVDTETDYWYWHYDSDGITPVPWPRENA